MGNYFYMNTKKYILIFLISSLAFTASIQSVKADDPPYQNVRFGFNSQDELVVSFDWIGMTRLNVSMAVGFNGRIFYESGLSFFPNLSKDVTAIFEEGINPNAFIPDLFGHSDFIQGQSYSIPVLSIKKWTPQNFIRVCNWLHPCPVTRPLVEEVIGRPFNEGDYITIAFDSNNPIPIKFSDPAQYHFIGEQKIPIIIVPGIMGTRLNLVSDGEEVWPNGGRMVLSGSDEYLNALQLTSDVQDTVPIDVGSIVGQEFVAPNYQPLLDLFINNGYVTGTNLFTVPFDWRKLVSDQRNRLGTVLQEAINRSPNGKVNIITHSTGGLLVKDYLLSTSTINFVDKLVFVGVPQIGAPKAFKILNYGDNFNFNLFGFYILNSERMKIISQNMPGAYQLLPSRKYVELEGGYVQDYRNGAADENPLSYDQTNALMAEDPLDQRNVSLLNQVDAFHQNLDTQTLNLPNIYNIAGCLNPTIRSIRAYDNGKFDINTGSGDGTVPLASALYGSDNYQNYFVLPPNTKENIDHLGLVQEEAPLDLIKKIIDGNVDQLPYGISSNEQDCFPFSGTDLIIVSTHSPVTLHIYDSQNHHTGPVENGDIELGISGSNYTTIGENNFAFLPADENYRFVINAYASGNFDFKVKSYAGENLESMTTYVNVPIQSDQTMATLNFSTTSIPQLELDNDGNGSIDQYINPTGLLVGSSTTDVLPSEITIIAPESRNYPRSELIPLSIESQDSESGVAYQDVYLNDQLVATNTIDLFFEKLGTSTVQVLSSDAAGNFGSQSMDFRVIATPDSTISDIERSFSLGWITKKGIKETLINKLEQAIKIEKRIETLEEKLPNDQKILRRIEKLEKRIDKVLGKNLLKELEKEYNKGTINNLAFELLREDVKWLLND